MKQISDMTAEAISPEHIHKISDYLENWEEISLEDKMLVVDGLISKIHATSENVNITWKL